MCLVQNADDFFILNTPDDFNLILKLAFGISALEPGFNTKLIQQTFIEPSRCQL